MKILRWRVRNLMAKAKKFGIKLLSPLDVIVTEELATSATGYNVAVSQIPSDKRIADIGVLTVSTLYPRTWSVAVPCSGTGLWECMSYPSFLRAPRLWPVQSAV